MTLTKGRIDRAGVIKFNDASLTVWEEGLADARRNGGWDSEQRWRRQFKRQVFARVVQQLRRLGWDCVVPEEMIKQYSLDFARDHRYCRKGDLQADLSISGRCIEFEMFQNVNAPDRPDHGGRYQNDKERHMPYLMRLEMERTRRRIRDYLCNVFTEYVFDPPKPKLGFNGVTAVEYAAYERRTTGHYVAELDRARISNPGYDDKSADGHKLEHGMRAYGKDRKGRIIVGTLLYRLGGNWTLVTGRYGLTYLYHNEVWVENPGNLRVKRNTVERRKRLEAELHKAVTAMKFERAAVLRDILFPGDQTLYVVWNNERQLYHCTGFRGYTADHSKAGKFTADEVRGWDCKPNRVIPLQADKEAA
ncbi:MAG TPA: UvrB/UvrC motif-containing protein [Noviherbaspirillum sp.]|nr:UvrB/UvrC motif-containing protein [Noviherbaspirillum sp.]